MASCNKESVAGLIMTCIKEKRRKEERRHASLWSEYVRVSDLEGTYRLLGLVRQKIGIEFSIDIGKKIL